jgi:pSer/pThr/pTyr-binding forkhead associated (FHA) protein/outer membrane protein assembly factor BamB
MLQLHFKENGPEKVPLEKSRMTIGRDAQNDIVLDHDGVSGFHAEIQNENGQSFLVDLGSSNGTFVNGERLSGRRPLSAWDSIRFDKVAAEIVDPDRRRPTAVHKAVDAAAGTDGKTALRPAAGGWVVKGRTGALAGKAIPLAGKVTIGRDPGNDIVIDDQMVSSRHARIEIKGDKPYLTDLGSSNGTFVNGGRITEKALEAGDEIAFDQVAFQVEGPAAGGGKTALRPAVKSGGTRVRPAAGQAGTRMVAAAGAVLKVTGGAVSRKQFELSGKHLSIGRIEGNDIILEDDTVSSSHGVLTWEDGAWHIEDKGSANGTFVNGKKITSHSLKQGDTLQLGEVHLRFEDAGKPAGGTKMMPAAKDGRTPKTAVMPAAKKGIPGWVYGLIGFVVMAAILFFVLFFTGKPEQIQAQLQAGKLWARHTENRQAAATPVLSDINGDDYLDVVVADAGGFVTAFDGAEGKSIFAAEIMDRILAPPAASDLSGDGIDDIVVSTNAGVVVALNGRGQALWQSKTNLELGEIVNRPVFYDLSGDGVLDVIVPTAKKGLVALDGARGWQIWNAGEMTRGNAVTAPLHADVNADGHADFISVTDAGQVLALTSQEDRVWKLWEADVPPVSYASPLLLDAGDQTLVVIATNGGGIHALSAGSGRPAWAADINRGFFASPVAADANGDGVTDVLAVDEQGGVYALEGRTGDEIWRASIGAGVHASPCLMDLNGDRLEDLILLDDEGNVRVVDMARGREILSFRAAAMSGATASPVMGDVNNDEMVDIVVAGNNGAVTVHSLNRLVAKGRATWAGFLGGSR